MLIDTKQEIIRTTVTDLAEAEDALNVLMGRLPNLDLNDMLYQVLTNLRSSIEILQYIDHRMEHE